MQPRNSGMLGYDPSNFQANVEGLLVLPSALVMFLSQWQGLFEMVRQIERMDYEICLPNQNIPLQIFHVKCLKTWHDRETQFRNTEDTMLEREAIVNKEGSTDVLPKRCHLPHLNNRCTWPPQRQVSKMSSTVPSKTMLIQHSITAQLSVLQNPRTCTVYGSDSCRKLLRWHQQHARTLPQSLVKTLHFGTKNV